LGQATGKLVLQCLQSAISELQTEGGKLKNLYSVYLDDFNDYIYPGFVSLLNKSRSANVGVVFSHQSLGDLEKVSQDFKQSVLINTNVKIIMRSNDPPTAEHFSQMIGTLAGEKKTSRRSKGFLWDQDTGEQSVRTVEEYVIHPNVFKSGLGLGQGVTIIPHRDGRVVKKIQFQALEDYPGEVQIPIKEHPVVRELPRLPSVPDENSKRPNKLVA
jgi:conjugal transfer pilus assembly protein TraD